MNMVSGTRTRPFRVRWLGRVRYRDSLALQRGSYANGTAAHLLLRAAQEPKDRRQQASEFVDQHGLPVVLKPDVGQRGSGVQVLHNSEELDSALGDIKVDSILQAFAADEELNKESGGAQFTP